MQPASADTRVESIVYYDNTSRWILGQVASRTISGVVAEQTAYDAVTGLPLQSWSFGKLQQTMTYNTDGTVAAVKDGRGNTTQFSSWKRGIPQTITYADGNTKSALVDGNGWISRVTDENGYATNYAYDAMGRLASIVYPAGDSASWNATTQVFAPVNAAEYGVPAGHWRQTVTTGNGVKITYFDALWRPLLIREYDATNVAATQRFSGREYDHDGRTVFSSYPSVASNPDKGVWTTYDALGRVKAVSQDSEHGLLTTTTSYLSDVTGAYTLATVPSGAQTRTWYQMFDGLSYDAPVKIIPPEGAVTTIARDIFGKPISLVRGTGDGTLQATRTFTYNANQELCKAVEPESGATMMSYDGAGNLSWSAAGLPAVTLCHATGVTTTIQPRRVDRTYDSRNQLTSLSFPDGNGNQTWTYTPDGKPSQIITQDVASSTQSINTYTYNKRRLLTAETIGQVGGYNWALGYGYDANGALAGVQYPSSLYVDYAPNALGQPTRAGSYATGVSYYPNGGISQFMYGNGITHTMQQNARHLPTRVKDGAVLDTTYSYDSNGNVTQIVDALESTRTRAMTYDGLDRLVQATSASFGGSGQLTYSYDVLDNLRTTKLVGVKQYNYWYDAANRLSNIVNDAGATVIGFAYDAQGNLANKNGQAFEFDYGNRLRNAAGKETYRYDGHGRRVVSWSATQGNIISMYGQDGVLRRQDNDRKASSVEYVYLNGSMVAKVSTSTAPAAPVVTVPTYSDNGSYTISWNSVVTATNYEIQEQFNGGAWQTSYSGSALSKVASGKAGGAYGYRGRACRGAACSGWGAVSTISVQAIPSGIPVVLVPPFSNNGTYATSWTVVPGAASYRLEESANGGGWTQVHSGTALTLSISNRANGTYGYRASGCNAAGCGGVSVVANVRVLRPPTSAPALSAPSSSSNGSYTITWGTVPTAATYQLEEASPGNGWASIYSGAGTSFAISGKGNGLHQYRALACNEGGCSPYSSTVSLSVMLPPTNAPALSVPSTSFSGTYSINWSSVAMATTYRLEESADGGAWSLIHNEGAANRSISNKLSGTYSYRVQACNSSGCGGWSAIGSISVRRIPAVPANPYAIMEYSRMTLWNVSAFWDAVPGATWYELSGYFYYSGPETTSLKVVKSVNPPQEEMPFQVRACNDNGCSAWSATFYRSL